MSLSSRVVYSIILEQPCIENNFPCIPREAMSSKVIYNGISFVFTLEKPEEEYERVKSSLTSAISVGKARSTKLMPHRGFRIILPAVA